MVFFDLSCNRLRHNLDGECVTRPVPFCVYEEASSQRIQSKALCWTAESSVSPRQVEMEVGHIEAIQQCVCNLPAKLILVH